MSSPFDEFDKRYEEAKRQLSIQHETNEWVKTPAKDTIALFEKFADPEEFSLDKEDVTREMATGNFNNDIYIRLVTLLVIRKQMLELKGLYFKKDERTRLENLISAETDAEKKRNIQFELDDYIVGLENMDSVIRSIGTSAIIMAAASKGKEGWLGGLIISSKKLAEIITSPIQGVKKGLFGR